MRQRHHGTRERSPCGALVQALIRDLVYSGTTATLERINALLERVLKHRGDGKNSTDFMHLKLIGDRKYYNEDEVVGIAQELWHERCGSWRNRGPETVRKGIKRKLEDTGKDKKTSEVGYLRKRDRAIKSELTKQTQADKDKIKHLLANAKTLKAWKNRIRKKRSSSQRKLWLHVSKACELEPCSMMRWMLTCARPSICSGAGTLKTRRSGITRQSGLQPRWTHARWIC